MIFSEDVLSITFSALIAEQTAYEESGYYVELFYFKCVFPYFFYVLKPVSVSLLQNACFFFSNPRNLALLSCLHVI